MNCKPCYRSGRRVNGGDLGYCRSHLKTKCMTCGAASLGAEMCATCTHKVEFQRWTAKSQFRVIDPDDELDQAEIRQEKLTAAKFLAHQAVEVFFQALLATMKALWARDIKADDKKEAA